MAKSNEDKATFPVFAALMLLLLAAAIFFGIMMFTADRDDPDGPAGEPVTTEDLDEERAMDLGDALRIAEYTFDPSRGEISGSVMNPSDRHFVNVQVEFVYYDLNGDSAGVASDTTREVMAGETWQFNVAIDQPEGVSRVSPGDVTATERAPTGGDGDTGRQTRPADEQLPDALPGGDS